MTLHGNRISAALIPFHENLKVRFKEMKIKTAPFKKVGALEMFCVAQQEMQGRLIPLSLFCIITLKTGKFRLMRGLF